MSERKLGSWEAGLGAEHPSSHLLVEAELHPATASPVCPEIYDLCILKRRKWPNGSTVKVGFRDDSSRALKDKVIHYMTDLISHANLRLIEVSFEDAQVRVEFTNDSSRSMLGTACLEEKDHKKPTMWLALNEGTPDLEFSYTVVHECGHALLSCIHEIQNPQANIQWDKKAIYKDYADGKPSWSREKVDQNIFFQPTCDMVECSDFDEHSIMMYPIEPHHTLDGSRFKENYTLSEMDKKFIAKFYPKNADPKEVEKETFSSAPLLLEAALPSSKSFFTTCWEGVGSYMHWFWLRVYGGGQARPGLAMASL